MTVAELGVRMSAAERARWMGFYRWEAAEHKKQQSR